MNRILAILFPIFVLFSVQVQGEETFQLEGRIEAFNEESPSVWIGFFSNPPSEGSKAIGWTLVETEEFRLSIPQEFGEVFLLALQKDSVPLIKRISSNHFTSKVVLDFEKGKSLRGTVMSQDALSIPDAELSFSCNDLSLLAIPEEYRPTWKSNSDGIFAIFGLSDGDCKVDVVARPEIPMETFDIRIKSEDIVRDFTLTDVLFVSGKVIDHKGETVSEAEVTAYFSGDGWFETSTDKNGSFSLGPFLLGKKLYLSAKHASNGSTRIYEVAPGKNSLVLRLSPLTRIVGMVVDSMTGDPLDEFILHARRQHSGVKFPHKRQQVESQRWLTRTRTASPWKLPGIPVTGKMLHSLQELSTTWVQ